MSLIHYFAFGTDPTLLVMIAHEWAIEQDKHLADSAAVELIYTPGSNSSSGTNLREPVRFKRLENRVVKESQFVE